jgi:hypothetical protein
MRLHWLMSYGLMGVTLVLALGCTKGSETPPGGDGGAGGGGTIAPPPVPNSCTPPVTPVDVTSPTAVVGSGPGTCTEAELDAALAQGGIITFNCGTSSVTLNLTSAKTIARDTVIDGGDKITLSGGGAHRLFVTQGDVNFTVQNISLADAMVDGTRGSGPSAANSGAAIYRQSNGKLAVIHATFTNNRATLAGNDVAGGAIYSYGGDTIVTGSTFDGNRAASGGAIGNLRSNLTIVNSTFVNNAAVDQMGGAIALDGQNADHGKIFTLCGVIVQNNSAALEGGGVYRYGYPGESTVIDSSTFDGNSAENPSSGLGGGLYVHTDTAGAMPLMLTSSTISRNSAGHGAGGLFLYQTPASLTNVTIADNLALNSLGGGLAANGVSGTLKNCTIAGNHADNAGSFGGGIIGGSKLTLLNTIIANNTAGNAWNPVSCTEQAQGGDHDLQYPSQQGSGQADTPCVAGIAFADPLLGLLGDNGGPTQTMALLAGSPAIGAGADCPATDQRGHLRSTGCDLGAYQHDSP